MGTQDQMTNEGQKKLLVAIESIRQAVRHCVEGELWLPCLILLYATIDSMARLAKDTNESNEDVTRVDFIAWCKKYVIPQLSSNCTGDDLYGARCGIIHSNTAESRLMRAGKARPLWYDLPDGRILIPIQTNSRLPATKLAIKPFVDSVLNSLFSFVNDAESNDAVGKRVWDRADRYYSQVVPLSTSSISMSHFKRD